MEGLSRYLKKFKLAIGDKTEEKRIIQSVFKTELNFDVSFEQIRIETGVAIFDLRPIERGEMMMRKNNLLKALSEKGLSIIDLR